MNGHDLVIMPMHAEDMASYTDDSVWWGEAEVYLRMDVTDDGEPKRENCTVLIQQPGTDGSNSDVLKRVLARLRHHEQLVTAVYEAMGDEESPEMNHLRGLLQEINGEEGW